MYHMGKSTQIDEEKSQLIKIKSLEESDDIW